MVINSDANSTEIPEKNLQFFFFTKRGQKLPNWSVKIR